MSNTELKAITTIEIVDAIEKLIQLKIDNMFNCNAEKIEIQRRTIADGLRFHSGSKGIIAGEQ